MAAPVLDQSNSVQATGGTTTTIDITTGETNTLVLVACTAGGTSTSVTPTLSLSGAALTWTALDTSHAASGAGDGGYRCAVQMWWAFSSAQLTSETVTITSSQTIDDWAVVYGSFAKADAAAPIDPNGNAVGVVPFGSASTTLSLSSTNSHDVAVVMAGSNYISLPTVDSGGGSTYLDGILNSGGARGALAYVAYATYTSAQTNVAPGFSSASDPAGYIGVMITGSTAANIVNVNDIDHWRLTADGGVADFFFAPNTYVDLSVRVNRLQFHRADLTAIDLRLSPFVPRAFFSVAVGDPVADDFHYNNTSYPDWTIVNGPLELGDCAAGAPVDDPGTPADLLPGQIIFWGLTLGGGSDLSTPAGDAVGGGSANILFTGLTPSGSDLNSPVGAAGQITFTGRKPGAIFVRYRDPRTPAFFVVELDVYSTDSPGAETLRVSDIGYRSRASDSIGLQVYPSVLNVAFDIDRHLGLEPGQPSSAGFGSVVLHNVGQRYDAYTLSRNSDSRNVKILVGNKSTDPDRGVLIDPPYAELRPFFGGAALPWTLSEGSLEIPLRDATYWADRPLQTKLYAGTGGYEGGSDLTGKPVPVTRGGGLGGNKYVQNVPLVPIDTVNLIYQWTDGPGDVHKLYEGGGEVFTREADSTNLYSGGVSPGAFRVDKTRGLLQVGSIPVRQLTADVSGEFPTAGLKTTAVDIARYVLTELMGQPESELELASWYNADSRYPYEAGFWQGTEPVQGLDVVRYLLGSIGARLFTFRDGRLGVAILRALAADVVPSFTINEDTAISVEPVALPSKLDPPPWRWRVSSFRMNLVQTSDFDAAINPVRKTHVSQEMPFLSVEEAPELKDIWRRPNDPDPVSTALLNVFTAQDLAADMLALWRNRPGLYAVTMPYEQSAEMEVGDVVLLDWPLADLEGGKAGQVVGEQVRSYDGTGKIYVLAG